MAPPKLYRPRYTGSRALVVGINGYQYVAPLQYARQDAEAIAAVLQDRFGFPPANVTLLLDRDATRSAIRDAYMTYTRDPVEEDDRVLIFYAGHGHTHS